MTPKDHFEQHQACVLAVEEIKDMIAVGDSVPRTAFFEWETRVRPITDELLARYEAAGDAAGIERVRVLQAQIDKAMRLVNGERDDA